MALFNNAFLSAGVPWSRHPRTPFSAALRALVFSLGLVLSSLVGAYQDPLDVPAQPHPAAAHALVLDLAKAGQRLVAVGERGHILYSDDQGTSWQQARVPSQAHLNAVFFIDETHGWAVGEDAAIMASEDGGASWRYQFDAREAEVKGPLLDIYFNDPQHGLAIGVYGKLYTTRDGGRSWQQDNARIDNLDEWHLNAIGAAEGGGGLYIAGESGTAYRSRDGGRSWDTLEVPHDGSFFGVAARRDGAGELVALFGVGGNLLLSRDGGDSWQAVETGTKSGLAAASWLADGALLIAGSDGVILKSDPSLQRFEQFTREDRIPLSAIAVSGDYWVFSGLAGVARMPRGDKPQ